MQNPGTMRGGRGVQARGGVTDRITIKQPSGLNESHQQGERHSVVTLKSDIHIGAKKDSSPKNDLKKKWYDSPLGGSGLR